MVHDSLGFPVVGASVLITPGGSIYRTDSAGRFFARHVPVGSVTISVRRLGFSPIRSTVSVPVGTEQAPDLTMRRLPRLLPEVEITAVNQCPRFAIEGILCRREAGTGFFVNREDILAASERITLPNLILSDLPGFAQDPEGNPTAVDSIVGTRCSRLIVDGGFPYSSRPIRSVQDVYAIEVFQPPDVPSEYEHWTWGTSQPGQKDSTSCALVVIWSVQEAQRSLRRLEGGRKGPPSTPGAVDFTARRPESVADNEVRDAKTE
jgi:hypothetical protein